MTNESARPFLASAIVYPPNSDLPSSEEGPLIPDETPPVFKPMHMHAHQPTFSGSRHSSLSSFLDDNAGLLLVLASQLFASAMNLSVKVLNSLDEPVPALEV